MKIKLVLALGILFLSLTSLLVLWQTHAAVPSSQGQRLFFDDFTSSQLSPQWNAGPSGGSAFATGVICFPGSGPPADCLSNGNLTQNGGWMSITTSRSLLSGCCPTMSGLSVMANNTSPIISSATPTQFVYMVWRLIPFNLTQVGNNGGSSGTQRNSETIFGLFSSHCSGSGGFCINRGFGIGWQLVESDSLISTVALGTPHQREAIGILIDQPMGNSTTANCYFGNGAASSTNIPGELWGQGGGSCLSNNRPAILYSNANGVIDLNTVHVFIMEAQFDAVNHNSWAAFRVDENAWMNITQSACSCIDRNSAGGSYLSLYPAINQVYCLGVTLTNPGPSCAVGPVNQSLGTLIDYVLVYNYVPSSLPAGQAVPNPGISGQIGPQGLRSTFPNYLVALAYELGKGIPLGSSQFLMSQVQFGGFLLFLITIMVITIPGVILHVRNPMIYSFLAFIISIIYFGLGVLALWFFGSIVLLFLGIMVGTVPASLRHTGGGGEVE